MEKFFTKKIYVDPYTKEINLDLSYLSNFDDYCLNFLKKSENVLMKDNLSKDKTVVLLT